MKTDIILSGVGGQGIVTIAATIGYAALQENMHLKQSEVHGMSQRGGAVQSHLRISDKDIASDIIPYGKADLILSVEPLESLRHLPFLSQKGWLVTNTTPFVNIPNYPKIEAVIKEVSKHKNHIAIDADEMAKEIKSPKSSNIIILGAAAPFISIDIEKIKRSIIKVFDKKGADVVEKNLKALELGYEFTKSKIN